MCFSSTASFLTAGALVPIGLTATLRAVNHGRGDLLPLALSPVFFGVQQGLEGIVWRGLEASGSVAVFRASTLGYLFFAYAFWLAWMPWTALSRSRLEERGRASRWITAFLLLGILAGAALWLPLLFDAGGIHPAVVRGSIDYRVTLLGREGLDHAWGSLLYAAVITVPLFLVPSAGFRFFAALVLVSLLVTQLGYAHAFASVWCYFSALASSVVIWIVEKPLDTAEATRG